MLAPRARGIVRVRPIAGPALGLLLVLTAACGDDDSDDTTEPLGGSATSGVTAEQLNGRTFMSTEVAGQTLAESTYLTLVFDAGNVGATAGCNTMSGAFEIDQGLLSVGQLRQTLIGCPEDLAQQDEWVSALLTSSPAISLDGGALTLAGADVTVTLEGAAETASLDATAWSISALEGPDGPQSAPDGASLTIADGTISVATGCNRGFGNATTGEGTITIGPLALTRMACAPEVAQWETSLTSFLDGELTYEVSDEQLVLVKGDTMLTLQPLV